MEKVDIVDDINLVNGVLDGDINSFEKLVTKYEVRVFRFVYNILKQKEATEDITQEVFITIYNKLYMYDKKYSFSTWLFQIAKNKTIDYIRKYGKLVETNIEEIYNMSSKEMLPLEQVEYKETREYVKSYIDTLKDEDKRLLYLRYGDKKTFNEISEILGVPESTIKRKYYRIRENYKAYIRDKEVK